MAQRDAAPRAVRGQREDPSLPRFAGLATFALLPRLDEVDHADIAVVGLPFDAGTTFRPGARFGPAHIREQSRQLHPYHQTHRLRLFEQCQVADAGDVGLTPFDIAAAVLQIERAAEDLSSAGARLLALGGDHTVALPLLRVAARRHGPLAVVHFDAHLDTWDANQGASVWHGSPFRRAAEEGLLDQERCIHVGIRGGVYDESELVEDGELGFARIRTDDYQTQPVGAIVERIRERVSDAPVYISIDIDVLDPAHAPGTGTPEVAGLTTRELFHTVRGLAGAYVVGADVVEVLPAYDHAGLTGLAAAHTGWELIALMATRLQEAT
jgi:agmatinase